MHMRFVGISQGRSLLIISIPDIWDQVIKISITEESVADE